MKLCIAGSRNIKPGYGFIDFAVKQFLSTFNQGAGGCVDRTPTLTEIVSGGAQGVDAEGEHFASHWNLPIHRMPAEWKKHGKAAGPIRNAAMAKHSDALLLIWNGESAGSASMKREMEKLNKPIYEVILRRVA